jgi:hypothetical protein
VRIFVTETSETAVIVVDAELVLFAPFGSAVVELTFALSVIVPAWFGAVVVTVIDPEPPGLRGPLAMHVAVVGVFEQLKPAPDAPVIVPFVKTKLTVGAAAGSGPRVLLIVAV